MYTCNDIIAFEYVLLLTRIVENAGIISYIEFLDRVRPRPAMSLVQSESDGHQLVASVEENRSAKSSQYELFCRLRY